MKEEKIEERAKKNIEKKDFQKADEEPSWYHYMVILGIIFFVFVVAYFGAEIFRGYFYEENQINVSNSSNTYPYSFKAGDITYNIFFNSPIEILDELNYTIEINEFDILNTQSFMLSYGVYNGSDNGLVSVSSIKLVRFLKARYFFKFPEDAFNNLADLNCSNSEENHKVMTFDPYADETGVFYNENYCIEFKSEGPELMMSVIDKLIWEIVKEYEEKNR
jgi:hypothetical protein